MFDTLHTAENPSFMTDGLSPWEKKESDDELERMRQMLLRTSDASDEARIRHHAMRDQIRAEIRDKNPEIHAFMPPMDY